MTKLLYIEASPRKALSYSSQVANEFLDVYRAENPDHEIEHLPLFDMELPAFAARFCFPHLCGITPFHTG